MISPSTISTPMLECDSNPREALTLHTSVLQQQKYFQVGINVTDDVPMQMLQKTVTAIRPGRP